MRCVRDKRDQIPDSAASPSEQTTAAEKEELSRALQKATRKLSDISAVRDTSAFDEKEYATLVSEIRRIHEKLSMHKCLKSTKKTQFPAGFSDSWSVVCEMERKRLKFAKFVVRNSDDCRTVPDKRAMRDELDRMILSWCTKRAANLTPKGRGSVYDKLLLQGRDTAHSD